MARYTGPKDRISRRFLVPLFGSSRALERRNYPPGQHGLRGGRRKKSDYAIALGEKQKLKFQYGVLEKQFRRCFHEAARRRGCPRRVRRPYRARTSEATQVRGPVYGPVGEEGV